MIDSTFVQKIADLALVQEFCLPSELALDGRIHHFTNKPVTEIVPAAPPLLDKVAVHTLEGINDLIQQSIDALDPAKYFLQVDDVNCVTLNTKTTDAWGRRQVLIEASPVEFSQFRFGQWIAQEEFCIGVAALFAETDDKEYVLTVASEITSEESAVRADSGFAQTVTVKAGLKPKETVTLKRSVNLAPFRLFPECQQPISSFIFRARQTDNGPMLMLVEGDGGRWKIAAINEIARFLRALDTGIEIIS